MTTRSSVRRLLTRTVPPVGAGGLALGTAVYAGASAWVVAVCAVVAAGIPVLPQLLPQESEHRRDVWRDWLHHRERMARLRLASAQARPHAAATSNEQHEQHEQLR